MITGFRKPKRSGNLRKKVVTDNDDDVDSLDKKFSSLAESEFRSSVNTSEKERVRAKEKTKKSSKPAGLLSFEDDTEDADVFQVKKTLESKRLARRLENERKGKKKPPQDPTIVSKEQDSDRQVASASYKAKPVDTKQSVLSTSGKTASDIVDDDSDDSLPAIKAGLNSGFIPDAATIFALKKKREQARQLGGTGDFIPVTTKETTKYEGRFSNTKSRLVREEDEDDSDEDRMEFKGSSVKSFPALERRSQVAKALEEAQEEEENENEEEDEVALWEKEQIKKGTGIPAGQTEAMYGPQIPPEYAAQPQVPVITADQYYASTLPQPPLPPSSMIGLSSFQAPATTMLAPTSSFGNINSGNTVSADMVAQRLSERLSSLVQVHRAHKLEREKICNDLQSSEDNIVKLEKSSQDLSDRFSFYQDLQGYFQDFVECLNEKVPKINECEKLMHLLWRVRAEKFSQRRSDDTKDQDSEVLGKSTKQGSSIDEYGRDRAAFEENARKRRVAEREGRRNRRRRHREKTLSSEDLSKYHEGLSSDDEELDADVLRFEKDKEKVLTQAKTIFEDVIDDFSSISEIQSRFIQWRLGFQDSYKEAFADLSLPKVLSPFIRLELLSWNPLEANCCGIESMAWYRSLKKFGNFKEKSKEEEEEQFQRMSLVIEKVLLPKLTVFVESVWDPLSSKQTESLASCIAIILDKHPMSDTSNQKKELLKAVSLRLKRISESGMFLPLYGKGLIESKSSGAVQFLKRQFWSSFKLLKNTLHWIEILSEKDVQDVTIEGILNRYLIAALQQFPNLQENSELSRTIISTLPKTWFETNSDNMLPGLEPFSRYLVGLAGAIYKTSLGYSTAEKKKAKLATKRIISLLMHMHAFDVARSVAVEYKYDL